MKSTSWYQLSAEELVFPANRSDKQTTLVLTNTNDSLNLVYKMKTTNPKQYVVKPNQGIIEPGSSAGIHITMHSYQNISEHKFLLKVSRTSLSTASSQEEITSYWTTVPKAETQSKMLRVSLDSLSGIVEKEGEGVGDSKLAQLAAAQTRPQKAATIGPEKNAPVAAGTGEHVAE